MPVSKVALRRELLAARARMTPTAGLLAIARDQAEFVAARRVALYVPMGLEPDTEPLIDWLIAAGRDVLLPVLYDDNDLGWGLSPERAGLVPGRLGLLQPPVDLGVAGIAEADLVICPALAVDRSGVRLGRGGGSYDRALARVPAGTPIWAAVYATELADALPSDSHDRPVHAALTPTGLIRF